MSEMLLLLAGLIIGGLVIYIFMSKKGGSNQVSRVHSTTILEKVEKMFKIVLVEGYFSEIYDYKHR